MWTHKALCKYKITENFLNLKTDSLKKQDLEVKKKAVLYTPCGYENLLQYENHISNQRRKNVQ